MANGDVTVVITARSTCFLFEQSCERLAFVQIRAYDLDHATATGRSRLDFYECHLLHLRKVEFLTVFERDIRSEEHTSGTPVTNAHFVCRLLLEKKKHNTNNIKLY